MDVSIEQLLQQFISNNENIYYESFDKFCRENGVIIEYNEFIDLLSINQTHVFNEYSDKTGHYWVPSIFEGYVSNSLPGDWDDFGDDQIEGITNPSLGDGDQQQPIDFAPLSNNQILDEPESDAEEIPDVGIEEPDLPDFDMRERHRPSRSVKELEGKEPDTGLITEGVIHTNQLAIILNSCHSRMTIATEISRKMEPHEAREFLRTVFGDSVDYRIALTSLQDK
jgi:hypothetical protein